MGVFFFTIVIYPLTQIIELAFTFSNKLLKNTGFSLVGVSLAVSHTSALCSRRTLAGNRTQYSGKKEASS